MLSVMSAFKNASSLYQFHCFCKQLSLGKAGSSREQPGVQREDVGQLSLRTAALNDHGFRTDVPTSLRHLFNTEVKQGRNEYKIGN